MNDLKEPYRLRWWHGVLLALVGVLIPVLMHSQCENFGEAFYFTDCLEGNQPDYSICCNWCNEYYHIIEFAVPEGATSTVFMVDDSEMVWTHAPNASDLFTSWTVFYDCEGTNVAYSDNGWCDNDVEVIVDAPAVKNDAYTVELVLPPGLYYLAIPQQGATGNSTISGCFGITVFSNEFLNLSVKERYILREILRRKYDAAGRRW
jgi:hypothetical protein